MGDLVFTEQVLRDLFLSLDTSGDGYLSYQELWDGLNGSDVDWYELNTDKQLVMDIGDVVGCALAMAGAACICFWPR